MRECTRCIHRAKWGTGIAWEDLPCAHCTGTYASARNEYHVKRQVIKPALIDPVTPDDHLARRIVLAWTHISRTYPAAAAYILAKMADQSLSYAAIARRYRVAASTVHYQISLAVMAEPEILRLISVDHTRNKRKAFKK